MQLLRRPHAYIGRQHPPSLPFIVLLAMVASISCSSSSPLCFYLKPSIPRPCLDPTPRMFHWSSALVIRNRLSILVDYRFRGKKKHGNTFHISGHSQSMYTHLIKKCSSTIWMDLESMVKIGPISKLFSST